MIEIIECDDNIVTPDTIGEMLRIKRCKRGLTQFALAEKAVVGFATVSAIESGRHIPNIRTICILADTLDLELVLRERDSL